MCAGDVTYDVEGFTDKNRDLLYNDLIDLAHATTSPFIQGLFPEVMTAADKRRPSTAGFKIKARRSSLTHSSLLTSHFSFLLISLTYPFAICVCVCVCVCVAIDWVVGGGAVALHAALHSLHQAEREEAGQQL
jgi:hypothetical protein